MTKSTSLRMSARIASSFLEAQGPIKTTRAFGCFSLMMRAVATIGVIESEMQCAISGNIFCAIIIQE